MLNGKKMFHAKKKKPIGVHPNIYIHIVSITSVVMTRMHSIAVHVLLGSTRFTIEFSRFNKY